MAINQVQLANTFNDFRVISNQVISRVNEFESGAATALVNSITANNFVAKTAVTSNTYTSSSNNVTLNTNGGINSGYITIFQGANANIEIAANGTGDIFMNADTVRIGDQNADATLTTWGTGDLILNTNTGTNSGTIRIYDGVNSNIDIIPNGTGNLNVLADTLQLGDNNADATLTTLGTGDLILSTNDGANSGTIRIFDGVNANIVIAPNGTGDVQLDADTVRVGDSGAAATITTNGAGNLTLSTNSGTNSGTILINQGANANIVLEPNGIGSVQLNAEVTRIGDAGVNAILTTNGAGNLTLNTNTGTNSGSIVINQGVNGNIEITPNGTGDFYVNADTVRIGDNGIDAILTTNGTGDLVLSTNFGTNSGTIRIFDAANGNIQLAPNGTGQVLLDSDVVRVGDGGTPATITTNGVGNLILSTNSGTNSGTITINQGANANIVLAPNGTGDVYVDADLLRVGDSNANTTITTNGTGNLTLNTNSGTSSGVITINQGTNGNINITPNGTGSVTISKVDINGGAIDGTPIGASSPSSGAFTSLSVSSTIAFSGGTSSSNSTTGTLVVTGGLGVSENINAGGYIASNTAIISPNVASPLVTTSGATNLTISTNGGTNSGTISIANGVNGNISLTPNGTGDVLLNADTVRIGDQNADATLTTWGTGDLILSTNTGTNSGTVTIADGVNGNISFTPNGTGLTRTVNSGDAVFRAERTGATATTFDQIARNGYGELATSVGRIQLNPATQAVEVDGRLGIYSANPNALLHVVDTRVVGVNYNANTVSSINTTANTITFSATSSGITNGDMLFYTSSGTAITGLTSGFFYYARVITANTVQLHNTYNESITPGVTPVVITGTLPSGTHTFKKGTEFTQIQGNVGNSNYLHTYQQRHTDGADWLGVSTRIQNRIDITPQAYIEFNPPNGTYGLAFGSRSTEAFRIDDQGRMAIGSAPFSGSGSLRATRSISGATFAYGIISDGRVQTDVTNTAYYFRTTANTAIGAAPYTISNLVHYGSEQDTTFAANTTVTNQYGFVAGSSMVSATNNYGFYSNIAQAANRWNFYSNGTANNYFGGSVVINTSNAFNALRITQTGAGNALVVEDDTNPDSSPFVIDQNGRTVLGTTTPITYSGQLVPQFQVNGTNGADASVGIYRAGGVAPIFHSVGSNGTLAAPTVSTTGNGLMRIRSAGYDGSSFIPSTDIVAEVDGSTGSNNMPGRLTFHTTPSGSNTTVERMRIDNAGRVGIGGTPSNQRLVVGGGLTGSTVQRAVEANYTVFPDASVQTISFLSLPNTAANASPYTIASLQHFNAYQGTFGANTTVTNQFGYIADSTLVGATNNFGFYSNIASGNGRWNFYAAGTADNYFAGKVGIGAVPTTTSTVRVSQTATGNTNQYGVLSELTANSDVTSSLTGFTTSLNTTAATFNLTALRHFTAGFQNIGAGSTVTNQYGFVVAASLTGANNNYGFYSDIPSGTGRWNFYAQNTANNYFAGNTTIAATSTSVSTTSGAFIVSGGVGVGENLNVGGYAQVDNLRLQDNTLSSTNTNGNVVLAPNGTGDVQLDADTVRIGDSGAAATLTTNGAGNLTLSTNGGTNSGTIVINQGANANVVIAPNGTGDVQLDADTVRVGDANSDATITTNGTGDLILSTNTGTNSGTVRIYDGVDGHIELAPQGSGDVLLNADTVRVGDQNANATITTWGTGDLILNTNVGSNSSAIRIYDAANGNIELAPNGIGDVYVTTDVLIGTLVNTNSSKLVANGSISETVSSTQWLVASQYDVGTNPNQIPLNQYLGTLAFQSHISGGTF
jgi:hypothetical protein